MKTPSGLINQKIEIHTEIGNPTDSGGVDPNSTLYWSTTAETKPKTFRRQDQVGVTVFEKGIRFSVRDRIDKTVTEKMYVKYRGAWYTIISALPDLVYQEMLIIDAVTNEIPSRNYVSPALIEWTFLATDYHGNESDIPSFLFSRTITTGATSVAIDFTFAASGNYLAIRLPAGFDPDFNTWFLDSNNNGEIPGFNWYTKITVGEYDYYLSKEIFYLNEGNNTITLSNV